MMFKCPITVRTYLILGEDDIVDYLKAYGSVKVCDNKIILYKETSDYRLEVSSISDYWSFKFFCKEEDLMCPFYLTGAVRFLLREWNA